MIIEVKKVKRLTNQEKNNVRKFLIPYFSRFPAFANSVYTNSELDACILLKDRDDIIGHVSIVKRGVKLGGKLYKIGGVGNVAVCKDLRHKGYGSKALQKANAVLRKGKYDLGLLFCHPKLDNFYTNCGWIKKEKGKIYYSENGREKHESTTYLLPVNLNQGNLDKWLHNDIHVGEGTW
jgi:predicted N-acetyltransferase YhbS